MKRTAEQQEWGEVPVEVSRALVECRRNRSDTRFHVPRLWNLWPLPLQQLEQDWDEVYVDEFPEISDNFARPGDARWDSLYADFTKHWLTHPSPYMKSALGLPSLPASASPLPVCLNPAEQLDVAILALGGRIARKPSLERPLPRRMGTPAEAVVALHPEPLRRETRVRKPSRKRLPSPPEIEEEAIERLPAPAELGTDLAQLQQLLARCMDLSKEMAKPDAEWARDLLEQITTEFGRQLREQRKALQQLIADIRGLMAKISRRTPSAGPAAKRRRPPSVKVCSDDEGGPEERAIALFVANTSGALHLLVRLLAGDVAESRSSPRAAGSMAELEDRPSGESRSRSRSGRLSPPPPAPAVCVGGKADLGPEVAAVLCSRTSDVEFPSEAALQSAVRQLVALFEAARRLGNPAMERAVEPLDAPCDRRGRPVHEDFVPALWGGVRQTRLRAVRLGRTPRR